ncbi:MAG: penicillin-binding protein 1A [Gammaproteobacteria bacterium]
MIRGALRLLVLFFVAWLISTQWGDANQALGALVERALGGQTSELAVSATFLGLAFAAQFPFAWCWLAWVPLDKASGPVRHPFAPRPLRIHLRVRRFRFLLGLLVSATSLLLALRALQTVSVHNASELPAWLEPGDSINVWLTYGLVHIVAFTIGWVSLWFEALVAAKTGPIRFGFVGYHLHSRPVGRMAMRAVLFVLFPLSAFAATSHPHPLHLPVVIAWLVGLLGSFAVAQIVTLLIERRHDVWLARLGEVEATHGMVSEIRWNTLRFLHPDRAAESLAPSEPTDALEGTSTSPSYNHVDVSLPPLEDSLGGTRAQSSALAPARNGEWSCVDVTVAEDMLPVGSPVGPRTELTDFDPSETGTTHDAGAIALERARVHLAAGEVARAQAALAEAVTYGERAEREQAEALLDALPTRRWVYRSVAYATAGSVLMAAVLVTWQWMTLPSGEETRRLARSAHIHVRKTGSGERAKVRLLGTRYDFSLNTRIANVSPHFLHAVVASEDHRFFKHGVTYKVTKFLQAGVVCVFVKLNVFAAPRECRGNSTIGQQLARNLFLSEERSVERKLRELIWALKMEWSLTKQEILELYVNRIFLGKGNFGVEMAARGYFDKSANNLSPAEAAVLAAAVKRPRWNWSQDREGALVRARLIHLLMKRHGYLPGAARFPAGFAPQFGRRPPHKPYLGHLWQWVRPQVNEVLAGLPEGDYKVVTSLNAEVQVYAERRLAQVASQLLSSGRPVAQGAVVVMRPNGEVLAMVGGLGDDVVGRGVNRAKQTTGLHSRPPASTFKPVVYLAALESGLGPHSMIDAAPVSIDIPGGPPYRPANHDGRTYGQITLRDGLINSVNTAAVRLLYERVGYDRLFDVGQRLGLDTTGFARQWGLALGQAGVPLIEMVGAYAVFANGGHRAPPYALLAVTAHGGETVWQRPGVDSPRVFEPAQMAQLTAMMRAVVSKGTGRRATEGLPTEVRVAGKTGTGDGFVDAWFIGFTDELVIGVWLGNDRPIAMPDVYGGTGPALAFNLIMRDLIAHTELVTAASTASP